MPRTFLDPLQCDDNVSQYGKNFHNLENTYTVFQIALGRHVFALYRFVLATVLDLFYM